MIAYWRSGKSRSRPPSRVISASPDSGAGPGKHWNEYVEPRKYKTARQHNVPSVSHRHACTIKTGSHFPRKLRTCPLRGIRVRNWTLYKNGRSDRAVRFSLLLTSVSTSAPGGRRRPPVRPAVALGKASHRCGRVWVYPSFQGSSPPASCLAGLALVLAGDIVELGEQRPGGLQTGSNRPLRPARPLAFLEELAASSKAWFLAECRRLPHGAWSDRRPSRLLRACA